MRAGVLPLISKELVSCGHDLQCSPHRVCTSPHHAVKLAINVKPHIAHEPVTPLTKEEDPLDIFSDSLLPLYDAYVPSFGSPSQLYTYTPPATSPLTPVTVRIPPQEKNELFAHYQWRAGVVMADKIATGELDVRGREVLELGAGTGLPGILCAKMGATKVVLSDYDEPAIVRNLLGNIEMALPPKLQSIVEAVGFSWGSDSAAVRSAAPSGSFDLILLADCLWSSSSHDLLLHSLTSLLAHPLRHATSSSAIATLSSSSPILPTPPSPAIHIIAGFHTGREAVRSFLRKAKDLGLVMVGDWVEIDIEGRTRMWGWDEGEEVEEPPEERNKWVVEGILGWAQRYLSRN